MSHFFLVYSASKPRQVAPSPPPQQYLTQQQAELPDHKLPLDDWKPTSLFLFIQHISPPLLQAPHLPASVDTALTLQVPAPCCHVSANSQLAPVWAGRATPHRGTAGTQLAAGTHSWQQSRRLLRDRQSNVRDKGWGWPGCPPKSHTGFFPQVVLGGWSDISKLLLSWVTGSNPVPPHPGSRDPTATLDAPMFLP